MPIKLSGYVTWSTSETVTSVQLPLNSVFLCLVEVLNHVFCDVNAAALCLVMCHRLEIFLSQTQLKSKTQKFDDEDVDCI